MDCPDALERQRMDAGDEYGVILGYMPMPENWVYLNVYLQGKPVHQEYDEFWLRHPPMDPVKRAKIFTPFVHAMKGLKEATAAQEVQYMDRPELCEDDAMEINRRLNILHTLTRNSRIAQENQVKVTLDVFVPCTNKDHPAYGKQGQIEKVTGICMRVDGLVSKSVTVGQKSIRIADIVGIEAEGIFEEV